MGHIFHDFVQTAVEAQIGKMLLRAYRDRKVGIIFDDAYGVLTEEDLRVIHEDAMRIIDGDQPVT